MSFWKWAFENEIDFFLMWKKNFTVGTINLLTSHRGFFTAQINKDGAVYQWALTPVLEDNLQKNCIKDEKKWVSDGKLHGLQVSQGDCEMSPLEVL